MEQNKERILEENIDDNVDEDTQKDKFLTFRLGDEDYGIEIAHVIEIIGVLSITEVPDMPDFVKGVINLRGRVIPVIDVRTRFHLPPQEYNDRTCFIVVSIDQLDVGLVVDIVNEVVTIPESKISPPPQVSKGNASRYVRGIGRIGDEVKILLDIQKLLHDQELGQLTNKEGTPAVQ